MPQLSIIVPVYNVEPYLQRCIDSILAQTFTDFELILIDDGSPDRCGEIMEEYAARDSRIITIHQKNKGVSAARNAGLRIARGTYVGFVDPDDWIETNMYEILIREIESNDCDIASCAWINDYEDGRQSPHTVELPTQTLSGESYRLHLFDMPNTIAGSVCNKLLKRKLIKEKFSTKYRICEDNLFLAGYCRNIRFAVHINKHLYHIFNRSDSATRNNQSKIVEGLAARRKIIELMSETSVECKMKAEFLFLDQCLFFLSFANHDSISREIAKTEYLSYMKRNFWAFLKNHSIPAKQKILFVKYLFSLSIHRTTERTTHDQHTKLQNYHHL